MPPTIHLETLDPACDVDIVTEAHETECDLVLNNSLAFGGYDAVVAFARPEFLPEPGERPYGDVGGA